MGFIQRKLVKLVIRVVSFPKLTLALCALTLAAAALLSWFKLGLSTDQNDLLTPTLPFFRDYHEFAILFPENESFVVILDPVDHTHPPAGKRWMDLADRVGASLLALRSDIRRVDWKVSIEEIGDQGLLFADWETVKSSKLKLLAQMASGDPLMNGYQIIPDESKRGTSAYERDRILVINVYAQRDYSSLADVTEPLKRMRAAVASAAKDFPDFKSPIITGRPALEADEMATSDRDTKIAEILGLSLVFIMLFLFLRSLWLAVVAELCLGVGIGWTFGWAALSVGRLNLLSLVFVIALIGIGMDYLIQILTRYRFEKKRYGRDHAIWARVFRYVSPPISTACAGAAGAFLVSALTDFRGAAELGIIAGGGLLLCLLAGYTVMPAILTLFPARVGRVSETRRYRHRDPLPLAGGVRLLPAMLWIAISAAGLLIALPPQFDSNLLKLQADGLPSVREVRKLPTWYAVILSDDLAKLRAARDAFTPKPGTDSTIGRTESLLDATDKQGWLAEHGGAVLAPKLDLAALPATVRDHWVGTPPPSSRDIAGNRFKSGPVYALYVYPRADLWEPGTLARFVGEVESRTPPDLLLTGIAPQLYHSTLEIHKAFKYSTIYALVLIFILVLLDLRRITQTLLAISVLALGLPMLLLMMWLWRWLPIGAMTLEARTGIPGTWNFANFFGLPILIGAGHEYGVFLVHRYREVLHDSRRVWRTWDVSDRALLLCAIVTSASFGFLVMAKHHGLQSLGWVMAVGTACIYLSALLVLRPILIWRLKHKRVYDDHQIQIPRESRSANVSQ